MATGRGAWTKIGMPDNGTVYYQLIAPVTVGAEASRGDAWRAVNYGVRNIQDRINVLGTIPRTLPHPIAYITNTEWAKLSADHQAQWIPYTDFVCEWGYQPKNGVLPFLTPNEYAMLNPAAQADFSPYRTKNGANGYCPTALLKPDMVVDGVFGRTTHNWVIWAQKTLGGLRTDGLVGQTTMKALLWPYVNSLSYSQPIRHAIGGICQHESGWDPGAVGYQHPEDIGLVQINGPANPTLSEADRFDYKKAYKYCGDRLMRGLTTYGSLDIAIADYYSPVWAQKWKQTGMAPNQLVKDFVDFVKAWTPPQ